MTGVRDLLLVEDEPVVLRAANRVLSSEGIEVDLAADAESAADALRQRAYRVVLCDLMLPGSSGFTLVEPALAHPATQFVVITGFATRENAVESFRRGAFDFLPKPFDPEELLGVVVRALGYHDWLVRAHSPPPPEGGERGALGAHTWAAPAGDGSVVVGLGATFTAVVGGLVSVDLPSPGDLVAQGGPLARLAARDRLVFALWSPVCGRVLAVNERLRAEPDLALRAPRGDGWLVRLVPSDLEEDLARLDPATGSHPRSRTSRRRLFRR